MSRNKPEHHRAGGLLIIHSVPVTGGDAQRPQAFWGWSCVPPLKLSTTDGDWGRERGEARGG